MSPTLTDAELASLHKPPLGVKTAPLTGLDFKGQPFTSLYTTLKEGIWPTPQRHAFFLPGVKNIKNIKNKDSKTKQRRLVRLRHSCGVHIRPIWVIGPDLDLLFIWKFGGIRSSGAGGNGCNQSEKQTCFLSSKSVFKTWSGFTWVGDLPLVWVDYLTVWISLLGEQMHGLHTYILAYTSLKIHWGML